MKMEKRMTMKTMKTGENVDGGVDGNTVIHVSY